LLGEVVVLLSKKSLWRWPHWWPKHVGDRLAVNLHL